MKKLILLVLSATLFSASLFATDWSHQEWDSDFNGRFSVAVTIGEGEFPYLNPVLAVRTSADHGLDILIANVAHGSNLLKLSILIRFDDKEVKSYRASCSNNGDTWFLEVDEETKLKIIAELKACGRIRVRLGSSVGDSDYSFNLNGSTSAINKLNLE